MGIIQMIMGIILIYITARKISGDPKFTYSLGGLFLTCGILVSIFTIIEFDKGIQYVMGLEMGGIIIGFGLAGMAQRLRCNKKIEAIFLSITETRNIKHKRIYNPRFTYKIGNRTYTHDSRDNFSQRYLNKRFKAGEKYKIYMNPKNNHEILVSRKATFTEVVVLLFGILMMCTIFL